MQRQPNNFPRVTIYAPTYGKPKELHFIVSVLVRGPGTEYIRLSKRFLRRKANFSGSNSRMISMTVFLSAQTPFDRNIFQIFL